MLVKTLKAEHPCRNFILGSEWLYYKIYTGHITADRIIKEVIYPIAKLLLEKGIIDQWFFIRYNDPKFHIRVRFHHKKRTSTGVTINHLTESLEYFTKQDLVWKIQVDTYQREMERYGANTITNAEEIFFADSEMTAQLFDLIEGKEGEQLRWLFALRATDSFLTAFGYDLMSKMKLLALLKDNFSNEFGMTKPYKKQLDKRYREERKNIEQFMIFKTNEIFELNPLLEILEAKEAKIADAICQLIEHHKKNTLQVNLNHLLCSHIHMIMNRVFRSKNRQHEMICYDFLWRYYKSVIGRQKNK